MRRVLVCALIAMWASVVAVQIAAPATAANSSVTWTVDHAAKVITVTANLTFNGRNARGERLHSSSDLVSIQQRVTDIENAIKSIWEGQRFKCFTLHVVLSLIHISEPTRPY